MALADVFVADPASAAGPMGRLAGFVRALHASWRAARDRRLALRAILFMPAGRLQDLGISIHDVMAAIDDANGVHRK